MLGLTDPGAVKYLLFLFWGSRLLHFDLFHNFTFEILEKYPLLLNVYHNFFGFPIIITLCSDWIVFTRTEMITVTVICVIPMVFFFVIFPQYAPHSLVRSLVISTTNKIPFVWSHFKWEKLHYWLHCPVCTWHSVEMHCNRAQAGNTDWEAERIL